MPFALTGIKSNKPTCFCSAERTGTFSTDVELEERVTCFVIEILDMKISYPTTRNYSNGIVHFEHFR